MNDATVENLLRRHVLYEDESVDQLEQVDGQATLTTPIRRFVVQSETDAWIVGREAWVSDFIVATREDLHVQGQAERFGFLIASDDSGVPGREIYVNDPAAMAALGTALPNGIDPVAYAELLVQFHPYTSAIPMLLTRPDDLRRVFGVDALPDVLPFRSAYADGEVTLTFSSCVRYRMPASFPQLDVFEWRVTAGPQRPAQWDSRVVAEGLSLEA